MNTRMMFAREREEETDVCLAWCYGRCRGGNKNIQFGKFCR